MTYLKYFENLDNLFKSMDYVETQDYVGDHSQINITEDLINKLLEFFPNKEIISVNHNNPYKKEKTKIITYHKPPNGYKPPSLIEKSESTFYFFEDEYFLVCFRKSPKRVSEINRYYLVDGWDGLEVFIKTIIL